MQKAMLKGDDAKEILNAILDVGPNGDNEFELHVGAVGCFLNQGVDGSKIWTAFDNRTGDCWVEDFETEEQAKRWCWA